MDWWGRVLDEGREYGRAQITVRGGPRSSALVQGTPFWQFGDIFATQWVGTGDAAWP